jgi:hypothetical protein
MEQPYPAIKRFYYPRAFFLFCPRVPVLFADYFNQDFLLEKDLKT